MTSNPKWVGLDIGEQETRICILGEGEQDRIERLVCSTPAAIAEALSCNSLSRIIHVVCESGSSPQLIRHLQRTGFPVTVVDARKASRFLAIRQNKTDINDARGLAEIARLGPPGALASHLKSPETQLLRSRLVMRDQILRQRGAISNALRSLLRVHGSQLTRLPPASRLRIELSAELGRLLAETGIDLTGQILPLLHINETFSTFLAIEDKAIAGLAEANPITKRFMQVPGVGPVTALSFFSAVEDPRRFGRSSDVGPYLGLVPRMRQSGSSSLRSRITKAGSKLTRGHLAMSASVMLSRAATRCAIIDWGRSLAKRIGYSKAKVAVARKLAVLLLSLWKSGEDFEAYPSR